MATKILWVSKYALTDGIARKEWDGQVSEHGYAHPKGMWVSVKIGRHGHLTEAEAKEAAEKMRVLKIAALKKQVAKLEALRF